MTELEKKAEEYAENKSPNEEYTSFDEVINKIKNAYKDGYEQGQKDYIKDTLDVHSELKKENEELKAQIEKIKIRNCKNCKYNDCMHYEICDNCINLDKWELAE